jgi:hypothetical protein
MWPSELWDTVYFYMRMQILRRNKLLPSSGFKCVGYGIGKGVIRRNRGAESYPMGSDRVVNGKGWWKVFSLTTNCALPVLYIRAFKIPDDGNYNVRRNAGEYSTFETVSSRKPKLHIKSELRKRKDKIYCYAEKLISLGQEQFALVHSSALILASQWQPTGAWRHSSTHPSFTH